MEFLAFRLFGPFASWGDVAVGEFRSALAGPTKSAIVGLVAGALGVRREDHELQRLLGGGLGFAVRIDDPGLLVSDYHTIETPHSKVIDQRAKTGDVPATRRDELLLAANDGATKTSISRREYRMDALAAVVLWSIEGESLPWSLPAIAEALRAPQFVPYLGRKACTLGLPLSPTIVMAEHPVAALRAVRFPVDTLLGKQREIPSRVEYRWEMAGLSTESGAPRAQRVELRRDTPRSRTAWLFADRFEQVLVESPVPDEEEADGVSEQN